MMDELAVRRTRGVVRPTSIEAYHAIKDEGVLGERMFEVYEYLHFANTDITAGEVKRALRRVTEGGEVIKKSHHQRLSELKRMGLVRNVRSRPCKVTGRNCVTWERTDAKKVKDSYKPETAKMKLNRMAMLCEDVAASLESIGRGGWASRLRFRAREIIDA